VKVGDLIYDEHYGQGIVTSLYDGRDGDVWDNISGAYITFVEVNRQCFLQENLFHSVEVISESR